MLDVKLLKNSVLFRLKNRCAWGNSGKVELSDAAIEKMIGAGPLGETAQEKAVRIGEARKRLKGGKKLIVCPEYDAIKSFQSDTKNQLLTQYCNPSFIDDGLYALKTDLLSEVIKEIKAAKERLNWLVEEFLDVYGQAVQGAKVLGEQFNQGNYPETEKLRGAFSIEYRVRWTRVLRKCRGVHLI